MTCLVTVWTVIVRNHNLITKLKHIPTGFKTFCPFGRKCGGTGIPDGIPDGRLDGYFGR